MSAPTAPLQAHSQTRRAAFELHRPLRQQGDGGALALARPPYDGSLKYLGSSAAPGLNDVEPVLTPDYSGKLPRRCPPRTMRGRRFDTYL